MSYNYSNYTLFAIKNDVERYAYTGWLFFVVICSLLGDTTIFVASIKYNAFNLHKIIVTFIQHIAISDILNSVGNILPSFLSAIQNSGGSSKILNYVRFFITYYGSTNSASLIAVMSFSKLLLVKYPLRTGFWSKRRTQNICAVIWISSLGSPVLHLILNKDDVTFDYRVYTSSYLYSSNIWTILLPVITFAILVIPNCLIMISTVLLLNEARKVVRGTEESLRWQGIITVILNAMVYTLSILPLSVYFMAESQVEKRAEPGPYYQEFFRFGMCALSFNTLANFFVYSLAVASFRGFLKTKFQQAASFLSNNFPSSGNLSQKCASVATGKRFDGLPQTFAGIQTESKLTSGFVPFEFIELPLDVQRSPNKTRIAFYEYCNLNLILK